MTTCDPQIRDLAGRFLPGVSGNPGGRPTGLSGLIREATSDGAELVEFMLGLFRGEHGVDLRLRADAATWLADRSFGRPTQALVNGDECKRCAAFGREITGAKEALIAKIDSVSERMILHAGQ